MTVLLLQMGHAIQKTAYLRSSLREFSKGMTKTIDCNTFFLETVKYCSINIVQYNILSVLLLNIRVYCIIILLTINEICLCFFWYMSTHTHTHTHTYKLQCTILLILCL